VQVEELVVVLRTKVVEGSVVHGSRDNGDTLAQDEVGTEGSMAPAGVGGMAQAGVGSVAQAGVSTVEHNTQAEGDNMFRAEEDSKVLEQVRDVVDNTRVGVQGRVDSRQERARDEVQGRVDSKQERAQDKVDNRLAQAGGNALVQVGGNKLQEEVQAEVGEVAQRKVEDSKVQVRGRAYKWALGKVQDSGRQALGLVHEQALGVVLVQELGQGTQEAHKVVESEELAYRMVEGDHKDSGSQSWFGAYQCASGIYSWVSRTAYQT